MRNRFFAVLFIFAAGHAALAESVRQQWLLSDAPWQFLGAGSQATLPELDSAQFRAAAWQTVAVPHVFQTRQHPQDVTEASLRRSLPKTPEAKGRRLYLFFEGAATIADVYLNGTQLGQHRGAYTHFVFDATDVFKADGTNELAVRVDNNFAHTADCLPSSNRLYTVWGGLYRKVWLVATDPLHVDLEDYASPGIYITPQNVTAASAELSIKVLLRNSAATAQNAEVRAALLDPAGEEVQAWEQDAPLAMGEQKTVEIRGAVASPRLWTPATPNLYHVKVSVARSGRTVDDVTQPCGFRTLVFDHHGHVTLNGQPVTLLGANLHQEIESKASALRDDDFRASYAFMQDLGFTFIRLPHYPHAQVEYDLCDRLGIFCWAENGHSNPDLPGPTADQITTELVKQNYNHPSIAVWSVGNEAGPPVADREVPVAKALDSTRPVAVANMRSTNADFHGINSYPGWYGAPDPWKFPTNGYVTEAGGGGMTTVHCDYAKARVIVDKYEPEEYQQILAEARLQGCIGDNHGDIGIFCWWCLRDFTDVKYKKPVGLNTKGLLTYAGDKKDVYYLYRCFSRPTEPTVHITSQRYFIREGAVDNGIKAYSSAAQLTLTLNGEKISTLENGQYHQTNGHRVDHVFYWPVPLHTGKNTASVTDGLGHTDSAILYFYGANGLPEIPVAEPLVTDLQSSSSDNRARFMDMPVQPQWPIYYDLDSTADNSFDTLPPEVIGARWIAVRRVTKPGQECGLNFQVARPATVFVMATKLADAPSYLADAGFKEIPVPALTWRNNDLNLVPAQLYSRVVKAGAAIHLAPPDRDEIIMVKE